MAVGLLLTFVFVVLFLKEEAELVYRVMGQSPSGPKAVQDLKTILMRFGPRSTMKSGLNVSALPFDAVY